MSESEESEITPEGVSGPGAEVLVGSAEPREMAAPVRVPESLPILPLKNTVLFPHMLSPLLVNTDRARALIDSALRTRARLLVCVAVREPVDETPSSGDLHAVGTVMRIAKMLKFPDDSYRLLVQGVARVSIHDYMEEEPFFVAKVKRLFETGEVPKRDLAGVSAGSRGFRGGLVVREINERMKPHFVELEKSGREWSALQGGLSRLALSKLKEESKPARERPTRPWVSGFPDTDPV